MSKEKLITKNLTKVEENKKSKKEYRVSVVIPCFNQEAYIDGCIASLAKQNFDGLEAIFVDDGSTDATKEKIFEHIGKNYDFDIVYLFQENAGPGVARNTGLNQARGKYIAFLDSDDTLPVGAYDALYFASEKYQADVVIGEYLRRVDNGGWYVFDYIKNYCKENDGKNCAGDYIVAIKNPSLWNRMFNREFLNKNDIRFLPEMHGEDVVFNLDAVKHAKKIYTTEAIVYCYTKRTAAGKSVSTSWTNRNTSSHIRAIKSYAGYFDKIGEEYAELTFLNTNFTYFLDGLKTINDEKLQSDLFEQFKEILRIYQGNIKYDKFISLIFGVDLDIVVAVPYKVYKSLLYKLCQDKKAGVSNAKLNFGNFEAKDKALQEFREGKIGFRYIIRYLKAWLAHKLKRKK